jgi:hypothetical protein
LDDQFTVDAQGRNQSPRIDVADIVLLRDGTICADTDVFVVEPFDIERGADTLSGGISVRV